MSKVHRVTIRYATDVSGLQSARHELYKLENALDEIESDPAKLKLHDPKELDLLRKKIKDLNAIIALGPKRGAAAWDAYNRSAKQANALQFKFDAQQRKIIQQIEEQERATRRLERAERNRAGLIERTRRALGQSFLEAPLYTASFAFMAGIGQAIQQFIEFDKVMTRIAIVTERSLESMKSYGQYVNDLGKQLGVTGQQMAEASLIFLQQGGLAADYATSLAEASIKLANITGTQAEDTSEYITTIVNSFKILETEGVNAGDKIVDMLAAVEAASGSSADEIANAFKKSASSFAAAGFTMEEATAILATISETTRQAPELIGTGMKTLIGNLAEIRVGSKEFEGLTNKVQDVTRELGYNFSLVDERTGDMKSIPRLLEEVADLYNRIGNEEAKRALIEAVAGKEQRDRFIALIENQDTYNKLVGVATNSAGKADEAQAKYMDSVAGKIGELKNEWEQTILSIIDTEAFKGLIESLTLVLQQFNLLIDEGNGFYEIMESILSVGIAFASLYAGGKLIKGVAGKAMKGEDIFPKGSLQKVGDKLKQPGTLLKTGAKAVAIPGVISAIPAAMNVYDIATEEDFSTGQKWDLALNNLAPIVGSIVGTLVGGPLGAAGGYAAGTGVKAWLDAADAKQYEYRLKAVQEIKALDAVVTENMQNYGKEIEKLAEIVTIPGIDRSSQIYIDSANKLAELMPQLSTSQDEYGNAVLATNEEIKKSIELKKEELRLQNLIAGKDTAGAEEAAVAAQAQAETDNRRKAFEAAQAKKVAAETELSTAAANRDAAIVARDEYKKQIEPMLNEITSLEQKVAAGTATKEEQKRLKARKGTFEYMQFERLQGEVTNKEAAAQAAQSTFEIYSVDMQLASNRLDTSEQLAADVKKEKSEELVRKRIEQQFADPDQQAAVLAAYNQFTQTGELAKGLTEYMTPAEIKEFQDAIQAVVDSAKDGAEHADFTAADTALAKFGNKMEGYSKRVEADKAKLEKFLSDQQNKLSYKEEIERLAEIVTGADIDKRSKEYIEAAKKLADLMPELSAGKDMYGNAVLLSNEEIEKAVASIDDIFEKPLSETIEHVKQAFALDDVDLTGLDVFTRISDILINNFDAMSEDLQHIKVEDTLKDLFSETLIGLEKVNDDFASKVMAGLGVDQTAVDEIYKIFTTQVEDYSQGYAFLIESVMKLDEAKDKLEAALASDGELTQEEINEILAAGGGILKINVQGPGGMQMGGWGSPIRTLADFKTMGLPQYASVEIDKDAIARMLPDRGKRVTEFDTEDDGKKRDELADILATYNSQRAKAQEGIALARQNLAMLQEGTPEFTQGLLEISRLENEYFDKFVSQNDHILKMVEDFQVRQGFTVQKIAELQKKWIDRTATDAEREQLELYTRIRNAVKQLNDEKTELIDIPALILNLEAEEQLLNKSTDAYALNKQQQIKYGAQLEKENQKLIDSYRELLKIENLSPAVRKEVQEKLNKVLSEQSTIIQRIRADMQDFYDSILAPSDKFRKLQADLRRTGKEGSYEYTQNLRQQRKELNDTLYDAEQKLKWQEAYKKSKGGILDETELQSYEMAVKTYIAAYDAVVEKEREIASSQSKAYRDSIETLTSNISKLEVQLNNRVTQSAEYLAIQDQIIEQQQRIVKQNQGRLAFIAEELKKTNLTEEVRKDYIEEQNSLLVGQSDIIYKMNELIKKRALDEYNIALYGTANLEELESRYDIRMRLIDEIIDAQERLVEGTQLELEIQQEIENSTNQTYKANLKSIQNKLKDVKLTQQVLQATRAQINLLKVLSGEGADQFRLTRTPTTGQYRFAPTASEQDRAASLQAAIEVEKESIARYRELSNDIFSVEQEIGALLSRGQDVTELQDLKSRLEAQRLSESGTLRGAKTATSLIARGRNDIAGRLMAERLDVEQAASFLTPQDRADILASVQREYDSVISSEQLVIKSNFQIITTNGNLVDANNRVIDSHGNVISALSGNTQGLVDANGNLINQKNELVNLRGDILASNQLYATSSNQIVNSMGTLVTALGKDGALYTVVSNLSGEFGSAFGAALKAFETKMETAFPTKLSEAITNAIKKALGIEEDVNPPPPPEVPQGGTPSGYNPDFYTRMGATRNQFGSKGQAVTYTPAAGTVMGEYNEALRNELRDNITFREVELERAQNLLDYYKGEGKGTDAPGQIAGIQSYISYIKSLYTTTTETKSQGPPVPIAGQGVTPGAEGSDAPTQGLVTPTGPTIPTGVNISGSKSSTNTSREPTTISVTGVKINSTSNTLNVGESRKLTATVSPSNATNKKVTWSSSNPGVISVSSDGQITAAFSLPLAVPSSATITATAGGKAASISLTVLPVNNIVAPGTPVSTPLLTPTPISKPAYTGNSIVEYLNSIGQNSSFEARKKLAEELRKKDPERLMSLLNYAGTATQNSLLLKELRGFETGGYTGDFKDGKLAVLHEKELVLNKLDTKNILDAVKIMRTMPQVVSKFVPNFAGVSAGNNQSITINAEFPNVSSADEIKKAFASMSSKALQYAYRTKSY